MVRKNPKEMNSVLSMMQEIEIDTIPVNCEQEVLTALKSGLNLREDEIRRVKERKGDNTTGERGKRSLAIPKDIWDSDHGKGGQRFCVDASSMLRLEDNICGACRVAHQYKMRETGGYIRGKIILRAISANSVA
jgi:hypothetical protein